MYCSTVMMAPATASIVHHVTTRSLGSIGERQNKHFASYRERCGSLAKKIQLNLTNLQLVA